MPITGRTPKECFDTFRDHLAKLLSDVLGAGQSYVAMTQGADPLQRDLQLGPRGVDYVALPSGHVGTAYVYLAQDLRVFKCDAGFQLKTHQYWYKLFDVQPDLELEPLFRWEYVSEVPAGKEWCRHHFQIGRVPAGDRREALCLPLGTGELDLNRVHVPTGFVLIEYVLRFLITELKIQPATSEWQSVLKESENRFFREFSAKTSAP